MIMQSEARLHLEFVEIPVLVSQAHFCYQSRLRTDSEDAIASIPATKYSCELCFEIGAQPTAHSAADGPFVIRLFQALHAKVE
jgi:hypothetical protein